MAMLAAQLHSKLSRAEEDLEDLLTSNVFGVLKYADDAELVRALLESVRFEPPCSFPPAFFAYAIEFWPTLAEESGSSCEPDVLLRLSGSEVGLVAIEAKFRSGKSSMATTEGPLGDQLAREWAALVRHGAEQGIPPQRLAVVYLTAGFAFPEAEIAEATDEIEAKLRSGASARIGWTSWTALAALIEKRNEPILVDLHAVLKRLGLTRFAGCPRPPLLSARYRFVSPAPRFTWRLPRLPQPFRFQEVT